MNVRRAESVLKIQTVKQGQRGRIVISVEEYEALMKAFEVLVKPIDRKVKLLGLDAPAKSEDVSPSLSQALRRFGAGWQSWSGGPTLRLATSREER